MDALLFELSSSIPREDDGQREEQQRPGQLTAQPFAAQERQRVANRLERTEQLELLRFRNLDLRWQRAAALLRDGIDVPAGIDLRRQTQHPAAAALLDSERADE